MREPECVAKYQGYHSPAQCACEAQQQSCGQCSDPAGDMEPHIDVRGHLLLNFRVTPYLTVSPIPFPSHESTSFHTFIMPLLVEWLPEVLEAQH